MIITEFGIIRLSHNTLQALLSNENKQCRESGYADPVNALFFMEIFRDIRPDISVNEVCRLLGNGAGPVKSSRTLKRVKQLIDRSTPLLTPRVVITEKKIQDANEENLVISPGVRLRSRKMSRTMRSCDRIKVFVATIGPKVEKEIRRLTEENKVSDASILDAIASVAVENTVEKVQSRIEDGLAKEGKRTTLRFSPGYCDWNIREQEKVFSVINGDTIDVSLTDTCLMKPRKSVSGVFGVGNEEDLKKRNMNPCLMCGMKRCIARRAEGVKEQI